MIVVFSKDFERGLASKTFSRLLVHSGSDIGKVLSAVNSCEDVTSITVTQISDVLWDLRRFIYYMSSHYRRLYALIGKIWDV